MSSGLFPPSVSLSLYEMWVFSAIAAPVLRSQISISQNVSSSDFSKSVPTTVHSSKNEDVEQSQQLSKLLIPFLFGIDL